MRPSTAKPPFRLALAMGGALCLTLALAQPAAATSFKTLARFAFSNLPKGIVPGGLVYDAGNKVLYGVTHQGGSATSQGTVFQLAAPASGTGPWVRTTIYTIQGGAEGSYPSASLVRDRAGRLYGATSLGGNYGNGTVFMLTPPGTGQTQWQFTPLYAFAGGTDGASPVALALRADGSLIGITGGGGNSGFTNNGHGTVFKLTPNATRTVWTPTILCRFNGATDPAGPTAIVLDSSGAIFGTSQFTADGAGGSVWRLNASSTATTGYTVQVLHKFTGSYGASSDGNFPRTLSIANDGSLIGTTYYGGTTGNGTLFQLGTGATPSYRVIYHFTGAQAHPAAAVASPTGPVIGTSFAGGTANYGTAFKITVPASGTGTLTQLASFNADARSGALPSQLIRTANGYFGTTSSGPTAATGIPEANGGTVFRLVP